MIEKLKKEAKELERRIEIMEAHRDGATIEYSPKINGVWKPVRNPQWLWGAADYRIAPEPTEKDFTFERIEYEEIEVGDIVEWDTGECERVFADSHITKKELRENGGKIWRVQI